MSLILDALNRSRDEASPVPGLAAHHAVERVTADRRQYLLWVALSVAVVIIAWLIMELYSPVPLPAHEVAVQELAATLSEGDARVTDAALPADYPKSGATTERVPQPAKANSEPLAVQARSGSTEEMVAPPEAVSDTALVVSREQAPQPLAADASTTDSFAADYAQDSSSTQGDATPAPSRSQAENDAVAQLYANPNLPEEAVAQRTAQQSTRQPTSSGSNVGSSVAKASGETIDVDRILRMAREEAKNASLGDHPVPLLIELSQQIKDSIPTVHYLRHDYSSNSSQSTVVLNSKTLAVGGSPAPGMKIEEILPDSVVLNYQGTQFRLRALNSWINL
jgi:general secretion pathway protein B